MNYRILKQQTKKQSKLKNLKLVNKMSKYYSDIIKKTKH